MDATQAASGLFVPYCTQGDTSQPLATALPLEAGKHLCLQHFLKRCRTTQQLLPPEQRGQISASLLDRISLAWNPQASGSYEGQPTGNLATLLEVMPATLYKLHPVG